MTTIVPTLPAAPQPTDSRVDFSIKAFNHVAALTPWTTAINLLAGEMNVLTNTATTAANSASASALTATQQADLARDSAITAVNAPGTNSTSTTTLTAAVGPITLTTQTGKSWVQGHTVVIAQTGNAVAVRMSGIVTSYSSASGVMTVTVDFATGGSASNWTISLGVGRAPVTFPTVPVTANTVGVEGIRYQFQGAFDLTMPSGGTLEVLTHPTIGTARLIAPLFKGRAGPLLLNVPGRLLTFAFAGGSLGWVVQ